MTRLDEIRRRLAAIRRHRWSAIRTGFYGLPGAGNVTVYRVEPPQVTPSGAMFWEDANLIANAPEDLAYLLAEVDRLQARVVELEAREQEVAVSVAQQVIDQVNAVNRAGRWLR